MARTIPCGQHDTTPAVLLITAQETGDMEAVCASCVAGAAAGLLVMYSGGTDPMEILSQVIIATLDATATGPVEDPLTGDDTDDDEALDAEAAGRLESFITDELTIRADTPRQDLTDVEIVGMVAVPRGMVPGGD